MIADYIFITCDNILLAWSVYIVLLSGDLSFAQAAFMSLGCYAAGVLTTRYGVPLLAAIPIAMVVSAAVASIVGYPALRIRGVYLMLVTMGITFCFRVAFENLSIVGGVRGLGGMSGATEWHAMIAVILVCIGLFALSRSPLQRLFDAVREDAQVAGSLGINVTYVRVISFAGGAAVAALAGALYGHYLVFVRPSNFDILVSIFVVLYCILGGVNNLWGPAFGATVMTLLPEFIRPLQEWRPTVFGVAIILLLVLKPDGLLPFRIPSARWVDHRAVKH